MAETEKKKPKMLTAKKRQLQNIKKKLLNSSYKAKVRTTTNSLEKSLATAANSSETSHCLDKVYSLLDKGVKKGVFKKNKAARLKSKYAKKQLATAK